jgi:hypothetical protein
MPRTRLAWILPLVQLALVIISNYIAHHSRHLSGGDVYWHPTFELFYLGLNAPVEQLAKIIYQLSTSCVGILSGDLIYLTLTAVFWSVFSGRKMVDKFLKFCCRCVSVAQRKMERHHVYKRDNRNIIRSLVAWPSSIVFDFPRGRAW